MFPAPVSPGRAPSMLRREKHFSRRPVCSVSTLKGRRRRNLRSDWLISVGLGGYALPDWPIFSLAPSLIVGKHCRFAIVTTPRPLWPEMVGVWPQLAGVWPKMVWPELAGVRPELAGVWPELAAVWPEMAGVWPEFAGVWPVGPSACGIFCVRFVRASFFSNPPAGGLPWRGSLSTSGSGGALGVWSASEGAPL